MKVYILTCDLIYCDIKLKEILGVYDSEDKVKLNKLQFEDLYKNDVNVDFYILSIEEQQVQ